ncbi:TNT domain-containing protein [Streptomyces sp. N2-109]|uniref:TNT domain-containing protein n=1 Tax=Streptomyces gossypii TaxID=2883101 RepID=A0ABT2JZA9_9ACTN|nr:TNT domain-containing protein [Streptomyces gossypii]MCT2593242.1 TNT domain-containing protein [Streptomyces gossypii]
MNRIRVTLAAAGTVVVLFSGLPGQATATTTATGTAAVTAGAVGAGQARAARTAPCTGEFERDARLGPRHLASPWQRPYASLLAGYERTGKLSSEAFLEKYWQGAPETGSWKYPPNDGFGTVNGSLDKWAARLEKGEKLDRFGSEYGRFLAPEGAAYGERALPPQSLNTREPAFPCDYHVYRVSRPLTVWQGSIAPWFEQDGGGQQILLDPALLPPSDRPAAGERLNVKWLVAHGYLARVRAG